MFRGVFVDRVASSLGRADVKACHSQGNDLLPHDGRLQTAHRIPVPLMQLSFYSKSLPVTIEAVLHITLMAHHKPAWGWLASAFPAAPSDGVNPRAPTRRAYWVVPGFFKVHFTSSL